MIYSELLYAITSGDGSILFAEAETLEAILLAAATIAEDGEDLGECVVMRGGQYDPSTTALVQEGMI